MEATQNLRITSHEDLVKLVASLERRHTPEKRLMLFRGQTREYTAREEPSLLPTALRRGGEPEPSLRGALASYIAHYLSCNRSSYAHLGIGFLDGPPFFGKGPTADDSAFVLFTALATQRKWKDLSIFDPVFGLLRYLYMPPFIEAVLEHYGLATMMLNVTFDVRVALFFATHRLERRGETSVYVRTDHEGLIYVLLVPWRFPGYFDLADFSHFDMGTRLHLQRAGGLFVPNESPNYYLDYVRYRITVGRETRTNIWKIFQPPPPTEHLVSAKHPRAKRFDYLLGFLKGQAPDHVLDVADHPYEWELYPG